MIQPFLDIYFFYEPPLSTILPFTLPTIIRIVMIGVLLVLFVLARKLKRSDWFYVGYLVVIGVYFGLHVWNAQHFNSYSPTNFNFSLIGEAFYMVRMLIPIATLVITHRIPVSQNQLVRFTQVMVLLVSGSIVGLALFGIGLSSYGGAGFIQGGLWDWFFSHDKSFYALASKGLFYFANSTSALEVLLTPLMAWVLLTQPTVVNYGLMTVHALACLTIGTKASIYGFIGMFVIYAGYFIVYTVVAKRAHFDWHQVLAAVVIVGLTLAILPFSPSQKRVAADAVVQEEQTSEKVVTTREDLEEDLKEEMKGKPIAEKKRMYGQFLMDNRRFFALDKRFVVKAYPATDDPDFWIALLKQPTEYRLDYRYMEKTIIKRVVAVNNNPKDKLFGITYTRMNNIFNIEQDFISQYYSMGIIGMVLLLGAYVLVTLYGAYHWLRYKACREPQITALLMGSGAIIALSLYTGNVMDFLTETIIIAFVQGVLIQQIQRVKPKRGVGHA